MVKISSKYPSTTHWSEAHPMYLSLEARCDLYQLHRSYVKRDMLEIK